MVPWQGLLRQKYPQHELARGHTQHRHFSLWRWHSEKQDPTTNFLTFRRDYIIICMDGLHRRLHASFKPQIDLFAFHRLITFFSLVYDKDGRIRHESRICHKCRLPCSFHLIHFGLYILYTVPYQPLPLIADTTYFNQPYSG